MRRTTLLFSDLVRSGIPPLLVAPVFLAYENPLRPVEPAQEPASSPVTASAATDSHTLMLLTFEHDLESSDGESPTHSSGVTFEDEISGAGVLIDGWMLQPHELLRAQFGRFADTYDLSAAMTKSARVRLIGNSVCPEVGEAVVWANTTIAQERVA
jgi:hypothetical protein